MVFCVLLQSSDTSSHKEINSLAPEFLVVSLISWIHSELSQLLCHLLDSNLCPLMPGDQSLVLQGNVTVSSGVDMMGRADCVERMQQG